MFAFHDFIFVEIFKRISLFFFTVLSVWVVIFSSLSRSLLLASFY